MSDPQPESPSRSALYYALEYSLFRFYAGILRMLRTDQASRLSGWFWQLVAPRTHRHKRALQHLEVAFPSMPLAQREEITRQVWNNLGRTTAEALVMHRFARDTSRIRIRSPEVMRKIAHAQGRVVVASMHYANWELIAPVFKASGYPMAFIYRHANNPHTEHYLRRVRERVFPGGVYQKGDQAPRKLISWLKTGHPILILADQRAGDVSVPFFGHPAPSTPLPAFIARNFDAPLVAARLVRTNGARFDLFLEEIAVPKTADRSRDIQEATHLLQHRFEEWIAALPGQWMWAHRRWHEEGPPPGWRPHAK